MNTRREEMVRVVAEMDEKSRSFGQAIIAVTDEIVRLQHMQFWSQVAFVAFIEWAGDCEGHYCFGACAREFLVKSLRGLRSG